MTTYKLKSQLSTNVQKKLLAFVKEVNDINDFYFKQMNEVEHANDTTGPMWVRELNDLLHKMVDEIIK